MSSDKISRNGRIFMLAYDQIMEHGPSDFRGNDRNHDFKYILEIAQQAGVSCLTAHYGLVKDIYSGPDRPAIPLVLKLNGSTKLNSNNKIPALIGSVEDALRLGAAGVGFTVYPGQDDENIGYEQFTQIRREAEKNGLATVLWAYARGPEIQDHFDPQIVGYAARVAYELGADVAKVKYTGSPESFKEVIKAAGPIKVIVSGTDNFKGEYLQELGEVIKIGGASGVAVGRNIWQKPDPIEFAKQVAGVVYNA